jgi:hypothetical protein
MTVRDVLEAFWEWQECDAAFWDYSGGGSFDDYLTRAWKGEL